METEMKGLENLSLEKNLNLKLLYVSLNYNNSIDK